MYLNKLYMKEKKSDKKPPLVFEELEEGSPSPLDDEEDESDEGFDWEEDDLNDD